MEDFIPLMKPNISDHDIGKVVEVLRSGMLVQGPKVSLLEERLAQFLNVPYASALSNGTATLHLALLTLGIGPGDEVIVPAFSYIATANVVELVGAKPVFVDIDLDSFNIDISKIEQSISKKTKAIIPVHEFGLAADIKNIITLAEKHHLKVIEDAACAFGATEDSQYVGTFGDFGSFSFHPRKAITSGEGGLLVTNQKNYDRHIKIARNHGIEYKEGAMEFVMPGFNYRLTDIQASLVLSQFERLDSNIQKRNNIADIYFKEINTSKIKLPKKYPHKRHTWQTFHLIVNEGVSRDNLIIDLKREGIGSNYGAQCMPYMEFYQKKYKLNCQDLFPNAMKAYKHGLAIPMYDLLDPMQAKKVVFSLNKLLS